MNYNILFALTTFKIDVLVFVLFFNRPRLHPLLSIFYYLTTRKKPCWSIYITLS